MVDADAGPYRGIGDGEEPVGAELTGQAKLGGGRGTVTALASVAVGLVAVVGLLFWLDRAAPQRPPEAARTPSGLVTTTTVARTTTPQAVRAVETTLPPVTLPPGEFLLGEETGLWLFHGGEATLQRLDLDNGELIDFGARAVPVAATGPDLVLYRNDSGIIGWVPLQDPGQQALIWKQGYAALGSEPGQVWTLNPRASLAHPAEVEVGSGRWLLFDTMSARILERRPGDLFVEMEARRPARDELDGWAAAFRVGPDVTNRLYGVAAYGPDGYRTLLAGPFRVLVYNAERMLVEDCGQSPCRLAWTARDPGVSLPAAQLPSLEAVAARFHAEGTWLEAQNLAGESELIELSGTRRFRFEPGDSPTLSPDGRWLAVASEGQVDVIDLEAAAAPIIVVLRFGGFHGSSLDGPPGDPPEGPKDGLLLVAKPDGPDGSAGGQAETPGS